MSRGLVHRYRALPLLFVAAAAEISNSYNSNWVNWLYLISPASIIYMNGYNELSYPWPMTIANFLFYSWLTFNLRLLCLYTAPTWLRRRV